MKQLSNIELEHLNGGNDGLTYACGAMVGLGFGLLASGFGAAAGVVLIGYASGTCLGAGLVAASKSE